MNNFDICMAIAFIITISITVYLVIHINCDQKINQKIKNLLDDPVETFINSDATDFQHYDIIRDAVNKLPDNFNSDVLKNPPDSEIISYGEETKDTTAYVTQADFGLTLPYPSVSCSNSSINHSMKSGPVNLLPWQPECGED